MITIFVFRMASSDTLKKLTVPEVRLRLEDKIKKDNEFLDLLKKVL